MSDLARRIAPVLVLLGLPSACLSGRTDSTADAGPDGGAIDASVDGGSGGDGAYRTPDGARSDDAATIADTTTSDARPGDSAQEETALAGGRPNADRMARSQPTAPPSA